MGKILLGAKGNDVCGFVGLSKLIFVLQRVSPLRRRPEGSENRRSLRSPSGLLRMHIFIVDFLCCWGIPLLREREFVRRDASLPATKVPCLTFSLEQVTRPTVGALPQAPPEALPLDSARGIPLDPSARLSWSLFLALPACLSLFSFPLFAPPLPVRLYKRTEICYHEGEMQSLSGGASYEC